MRTNAVESLVVCDPQNAIARLNQYDPTEDERHYCNALRVILGNKADRHITAKMRNAASKLAKQNADSSRRYADAYDAIANA